MSDRIQPRTLKGFRDFLPSQARPRERLIEIAKRVFNNFGFAPIDTPALEYTEILLGKGGDESDKQVFRFEDQGGRDVAMRFDLTVPFARYAAQHINQLGVPFKRYHIGTVWRGEKPQVGRYREFMQCDFDTIGTRSNLADVEVLLVIHELLASIGTEFGFAGFTIRVNNRQVLNGLLESLGLEEQSTGVLRALDKLLKIGRDGVITELIEQVGTTSEQAEQVLSLADFEGEPAEMLDQAETLIGNSERGAQGIAHLRELFSCVEAAGIAPQRVRLDLAIARGLDYYTGTIYETFLDDLPGIGSVCSGGRYDNLAELFTKQELPGVGSSLGLDRLLAALEELQLLDASRTETPVLITMFDQKRAGDYFRAAQRLREAGIGCEVFPEAKKLAKQFKYADERGFRVALVAGDDEFSANVWQVKNLATKEQAKVADADLVSAVAGVIE